LIRASLNAAQEPNQTLRALAEQHKRYVGFSFELFELNMTAFTQVADREFNCLTPENAMKWGETERQRGQFTFGDADLIVNHAIAHGQRIRGHTLVWHEHLPQWLLKGNFSQSELLGIMERHIRTQTAYWRGKIYAWDVVNEIFNEDGTLRHTAFYPLLDKSFIADAFRWAHEGDPKAKLYINEYNLVGNNKKKTDGELTAESFTV